MRYRRANIEGGTYFFTVNLAQRDRSLLVEHVDILRSVLGSVKERHPFRMDALVILPDHLHAMWTLPRGDRDFPTRWMLIKAGFSRGIAAEERRSSSRVRKGERGIWQRRYWEHLIRDEVDYALHMDYVHYNPIKHGHAARVADWPHSTFHRYVSQGVYLPDWGGEDDRGRFGERR